MPVEQQAFDGLHPCVAGTHYEGARSGIIAHALGIHELLDAGCHKLLTVVSIVPPMYIESGVSL